MSVAAAALASMRWIGEARRRRALFQFAFRFGLAYAPVDHLGLIDHTFDLFNLADGARCSNVMTGSWQGVPLSLGEVRFAPDRSAVRDGRHGSPKRFSFALAEVPT